MAILDQFIVALKANPQADLWVKIVSPTSYYFLPASSLLAVLTGQADPNAGQEGPIQAYPIDINEPFALYLRAGQSINVRGGFAYTAPFVRQIGSAQTTATTVLDVLLYQAQYDSNSGHTYAPLQDGTGNVAVDLLDDHDPALPFPTVTSAEVAVPYRGQFDNQAPIPNNWCLPDCIGMLLDWRAAVLGLTVAQPSTRDLAMQTTLATDPTQGLMTNVGIGLAAKYGLTLQLRNDLTLPAIDAELGAGRPVCVLINYSKIPEREDPDPFGHFIVIRGKDATGYLVNDPDWRTAGNISESQGDNLHILSAELDAALGQEAEAPYQGLTVIGMPPAQSVSAPATQPPIAVGKTYYCIDLSGTNFRIYGNISAALSGLGVEYRDSVSIDDTQVNANGYAPVIGPSGVILAWTKLSEYSLTQPPVQTVIPPAPQPIPTPGTTNSHILGINVDYRNPAASPTAAQLGNVAWVRFVLNVYKPDNTKQSLSDTLAYYDSIVNNLHTTNINICLVLNQQTFNDGYPTWIPVATWQQYAQSFAVACAQIATHYKGRVAKYEIWNEPDNPDPKSSGMAASNFGLICRTAISAIRQVDNTCQVVSGGLMSDDPAGYLSATGGMGNPDRIGFHPYTLTRQTLVAKLNALKAYGVIDITEDGFPQGNLAAADQVLTANYQTAAAADCTMFCWFAWSDKQDSRTVGLVDANGQPNGALWTAWQALIAQDSGNTPISPVQAPPGVGSNSGSNGSSITSPVPPTPAPVITPGVSRRLAGLGFYDPETMKDFAAGFVATCQRLHAAGKPLTGVLVMNDPATANALTPYVGHVIYRHYAYDSKWTIVDSWTLDQLNAYTQNLWTGWESVRAQLDPRVIIQPVCEKNSRVWSGAFFLKWMQLDDADGRGYKCGIFGDSPFQPADLTELPAREDAYRYAAAHGHWYVTHFYGAPTGPNNAYHNTLYAAMPADCRPQVLIGEASYADGLYRDPEATVAFLNDYETALQGDPYVEAFYFWMLGTSYSNPKFVANAALPEIEAWRATH